MKEPSLTGRIDRKRSTASFWKANGGKTGFRLVYRVLFIKGVKGIKGKRSNPRLLDRDAQGSVGIRKSLEGNKASGGGPRKDVDLPGEGGNEDHVPGVERDPHGPTAGVTCAHVRERSVAI